MAQNSTKNPDYFKVMFTYRVWADSDAVRMLRLSDELCHVILPRVIRPSDSCDVQSEDLV